MNILKFKEYVSEKLDIKPVDLKNIKDGGDPADANLWKTGDIIYSYGYRPAFWKIMSRTKKSVTVMRVESRLVSGYYNSSYEVEPDPRAPDTGDMRSVRIDNNGRVTIGDGRYRYSAYLWSGTPVKGQCDD